MQDTRSQLQTAQQALEVELQDLTMQVSGLEVRLAAEPAKQRAFALQVCLHATPNFSPTLSIQLMESIFL